MTVMAIVTGTTDPGKRWAHLWQLDSKTAGPHPECMVEMSDGIGSLFVIHLGCPNEWIPLAQAMYRLFRDGMPPKPTHTLVWRFGSPRFEPIEGAPTGQEVLDTLFDLDEVSA